MHCHMYDNGKELVYPPNQRVEKVRKYVSSSQSQFIEIDGWQEVEAFISDYVKGFKNPSKRSSRLWSCVDETKT